MKEIKKEEYKCKNCGWFNPDNRDGKFRCPANEDRTVWANTKACRYIELVNNSIEEAL